MRLCASITAMLVGSPTMTARGRGRSSPRRRDQRPHTGAPDLLVIGDDDVDRLFQGPRLEGRHRGEHASDEALHVAAAAAVELAVALGQRERVGRPASDPRPARSRYDPRARCRHRPSGPMVANRLGLGAVGRGHARRGDAVAFEVVLDEGDQREIRLGARGVEGDERRAAAPSLSLERGSRVRLCLRPMRAGEALADRARAFSASTSRSRGGAVVTSESISSRAAARDLVHRAVEGGLIGLRRAA